MVKKKFLNIIHSWYEINHRKLPFRDTVNPYYIWLSEIIFQQTKVAQGLPYYLRFIELYPEIINLAEADEMDVLNAWQGLGYYSRARNLHETAKYVVDELNSKFPTRYKDLVKLKGVGDYSASAISSFSSREVVPVLDGNVYRFISRLYGIQTPINTPKSIKDFKEVLNSLIDEKRPDLFNQAIIEFGALHCVPKSPNCMECPFYSNCYAYGNKMVEDFPVKLKKKKPVERFLVFFLIQDKDFIYILKRKLDSIWKGLYEFPNIESKEVFENEIVPIDLIDGIEVLDVISGFKHILSHQKIYAKLFICSKINKKSMDSNYLKIKKNDLDQYPIHRLMEKMVESAEL